MVTGRLHSGLWGWGLAALVLAVSTAMGQRSGSITENEAVENSALYLLSGATQLRQDGRHNLVLVGLRQLRDPDLRPFFEYLAGRSEPVLIVHGILGLAECSAEGVLDTAKLVEVRDGQVQAAIISAAMDGQMLPLETARQVWSWPGLDPAARLLVGVQLAAEGQLKGEEVEEVLKEAAASDKLGRRVVAGLIWTRLGDIRGLKLLEEAVGAEDRRKEETLELGLGLATKYALKEAGGWAMWLAERQSGMSRLGVRALETALRLGAPGAAELWQTRFKETTDTAQRVRLALALLHAATAVPAETFQILMDQEETLLLRIGQAGWAVASGQNPSEAIASLVAMQHPLSTDWAISYARSHADGPELEMIAQAVLKAYEGPAKNRAQRFEDVAMITQILYEKDPSLARKILGPVLEERSTDPTLQQAILVGLMRCRSGRSAEVLEGVKEFSHPETSGLALLLRARQGAKLSAAEQRELGLLVRGGGDWPVVLRTQAAWVYMKQTGRKERALEVLTGRSATQAAERGGR